MGLAARLLWRLGGPFGVGSAFGLPAGFTAGFLEPGFDGPFIVLSFERCSHQMFALAGTRGLARSRGSGLSRSIET